MRTPCIYVYERFRHGSPCTPHALRQEFTEKYGAAIFQEMVSDIIHGPQSYHCAGNLHFGKQKNICSNFYSVQYVINLSG